MTLWLATFNEHKVHEFKKLLKKSQIKFEKVKSASELKNYVAPEEDGHTFEQNSLIKARAIQKHLGTSNQPAIIWAEDSGITCETLIDRPGIYSSRFAGLDATDAQNNDKLLKVLSAFNSKEERRAHYTCNICLITPNKTLHFQECLKGTIAQKAQEGGGFGYDPIFIPEGYQSPVSLMTSDQKALISHRGKATRKAIKALKPYI